MEKLNAFASIPMEQGQMYVVDLQNSASVPGWLVHTQIELDGNRVFVRWIDTDIDMGQDASAEMVGIVVSPVY